MDLESCVLGDGSNVEIVKRRKVMKMRRRQIEMINCALEKRWVEYEGLNRVLMDFNGERLVFCLFFVIMVDSSSGNRMKKNPIAVNPILCFSLTHRHTVDSLFWLVFM